MGIDAGFESVELMLELRERLFQVGQFFGAGDLVPYNVPKTIPSKPKGMCIRWCTNAPEPVAAERPPFGRPDHMLDLGQANAPLFCGDRPGSYLLARRWRALRRSRSGAA
jgi:hypothetical protein